MGDTGIFSFAVDADVPFVLLFCYKFNGGMPFMKRIFHWLDENLEEFLLVIGLIAMTLIMGVQVF